MRMSSRPTIVLVAPRHGRSASATGAAATVASKIPRSLTRPRARGAIDGRAAAARAAAARAATVHRRGRCSRRQGCSKSHACSSLDLDSLTRIGCLVSGIKPKRWLCSLMGGSPLAAPKAIPGQTSGAPMPPRRFKTVAICLDAIRLREPAKLNMTKTAVRVLVMVATFAAPYSRDKPPRARAVCRLHRRTSEGEKTDTCERTLGLNLARQNLVLCATCCIISVLTQWGATLVEEEGGRARKGAQKGKIREKGASKGCKGGGKGSLPLCL